MTSGWPERPPGLQLRPGGTLAAVPPPTPGVVSETARLHMHDAKPITSRRGGCRRRRGCRGGRPCRCQRGWYSGSAGASVTGAAAAISKGCSNAAGGTRGRRDGADGAAPSGQRGACDWAVAAAGHLLLPEEHPLPLEQAGKASSGGVAATAHSASSSHITHYIVARTADCRYTQDSGGCEPVSGVACRHRHRQSAVVVVGVVSSGALS